MHRQEFENALKILLSTDQHDVPFLQEDPKAWQAFSTDPFRFLLRCDDARADAIWAHVQRRQTRAAA